MIVLGLDSGVERTGFALVNNSNTDTKILDYGCIFTDKAFDSAKRIQKLGASLENIIDTHKPDIVVIEKLFFNNNQKTVISVAQAQGVTMYIASKKKCPVEFLTPLQIKETITGYGRADKKQLEKMLMLQYGFSEPPKPDDVTDAIACALAFCILNNFNSKIPNI